MDAPLSLMECVYLEVMTSVSMKDEGNKEKIEEGKKEKKCDDIWD